MRGRRLTVLMYHRIADRADDPGDLDPALISASPRELERQAAWIGERAAPVSLDDVLAARAGREPLPPRAVLVTFDDAYRDFADRAWPLLQEHGVPATLFVATAYPGWQGHGFWWDRLHRALARTARRDPLPTPAGALPLATASDRERAHRALAAMLHAAPHDQAMATLERILGLIGDAEPVCPVLGWDELRRLAAEGVALAPHTRTHARLDRVSRARAREEIAGSRADLEREIGGCPPAFAFPAGGWDQQSTALLEDEGFALAFTTRRGPNDLTQPDWLRLRRSNVGRRSNLPLLRAQLLAPARVLGVMR
ncbi:MAG: colanic acid/amylovoran biosynthesis glycosyltransferase [Thermoleophilaceae bacterium]|nr:colanic acid/amylovoran biosynthesis glycosyltransferase [Thermoleophilaceae bacterium]